MSAISPERLARAGGDAVKLVVASLIGGVIVVAATKIESMVRTSTAVDAAAPVAAYTGPELSEEWKWKPKTVQYEHMYRKGAEPKRNDWIRSSGR